jgi:thiosulfate reductase cytochrome b subunit
MAHLQLRSDLSVLFPVWLTLGGSYDGSVDIHNEDGLAGALAVAFRRHVAARHQRHRLPRLRAFLSGHFRRAFFPSVPPRAARHLAALQFRLPHRLGAYNAVQKTLYLGVLPPAWSWCSPALRSGSQASSRS